MNVQNIAEGHTAVVSSVNGSIITIINQNTGPVYNSGTLSNGTLTISWQGYSTVGAIHHPGTSTGGSSTPAATAWDVIATEPISSTADAYRVGWNSGNGTTYTFTGTSLNGDTRPSKTAMGDMNNDGRTDIISIEPTGNPNGSVNYYFYQGDKVTPGGFGKRLTNLQNQTPVDNMVLGDFNGDHILDILASEIVDSTTSRIDQAARPFYTCTTEEGRVYEVQTAHRQPNRRHDLRQLLGRVELLHLSK